MDSLLRRRFGSRSNQTSDHLRGDLLGSAGKQRPYHGFMDEFSRYGLESPLECFGSGIETLYLAFVAWIWVLALLPKEGLESMR